jgi:cytochrome oxidase Cu insertion factor (SCO1/SenC/PrrC family)
MQCWIAKTYVGTVAFVVCNAVSAQVTTYCCDEVAETAYHAAIAAHALQPDTVSESFESGPWEATRNVAEISVTNQGIIWSSSDAAMRTSLGGGSVHDGTYLMFAQSQINPPLHPVPDGYALDADGVRLFSVGGWFRGSGGKLAFIVDDDPDHVDFTGNEATVNEWKFLGFVDSLAFSKLEIRNVDEIGDETNIFFSDDFSMATLPSVGDLQFDSDVYAVVENGNSLQITVTREGGSFGSANVDYETSDGSATASLDYAVSNGTLAFADGELSHSFSVPILDDVEFEGNETFSVTLSNATGGAVIATPSSAIATITEDDPPPPAGVLQFSSSSYSALENAASMTMTISRTGGSAGLVSVDYASNDGTAVADSDYVMTSGTLSFADGVISESFNISLTDDMDYEGDETFTVTISNATGGAAVGTPSSATATITEDDPPPAAGVLQFSDSGYSALENAASITMTVSRTGGSAGFVSVDYASNDETAVVDSDYLTSNGTLTFADGVVSESIDISLIDDMEYEGDETFTAELSNPTGGAVIGTPSSATATITEDDPPPSAGVLQFSGAGYSALENAASMTMTVSRTGGSAGVVSVDYASNDGTAVADSDYVISNGTLTFADGELSQSFNVSILDDTVFEGDETFAVTLSNQTGGAILGSPSSATATITEDDPPPPSGVLQFSGASYSALENAASMTVTVSRTGGSAGVVNVDYASNDGTAVADSDYLMSSGTLMFADGVITQSFDISLIDDMEYEGDETFTVALSNATDGATIGTLSSATVTITENDSRPPGATPNQSSGGGANGPLSLILILLCLIRTRTTDVLRKLHGSRSLITAFFLVGVLVTAPIVGNTADSPEDAAAENQQADPHAAHKEMMGRANLRRSVATYNYQDLPVTEMGGGASTLGDQISGKQVVVLNFIFTTCTTICPVQTATLAQVQRQLGEQASDVKMISISIDPEHDTPSRLREYSEQFRAGPQWQFLTGSISEMISVQKAFHAYHGAKMNHRPLTFIKPPSDDRWTRLEGMASAADIVNALRTITGS